MKNIKISAILLRFYDLFHLFCSVLRPILTEKYHKITNSSKKHDCFRTVFLSQQVNRTIRQSPAEDTCSLKTYNSNINY